MEGRAPARPAARSVLAPGQGARKRAPPERLDRPWVLALTCFYSWFWMGRNQGSADHGEPAAAAFHGRIPRVGRRGPRGEPHRPRPLPRARLGGRVVDRPREPRARPPAADVAADRPQGAA